MGLMVFQGIGCFVIRVQGMMSLVESDGYKTSHPPPSFFPSHHSSPHSNSLLSKLFLSNSSFSYFQHIIKHVLLSSPGCFSGRCPLSWLMRS